MHSRQVSGCVFRCEVKMLPLLRLNACVCTEGDGAKLCASSPDIVGAPMCRHTRPRVRRRARANVPRRKACAKTPRHKAEVRRLGLASTRRGT